MTATTPGNDAIIGDVVAHLGRCFPWLAVAVGGTAVTDAGHARRLGSAVWEADPALAAAAVLGLVARAA